MKILILSTLLLLTACGGGSECPDTVTRQRITDATGTYTVECTSFQCPGFTKEVFCRRIV